MDEITAALRNLQVTEKCSLSIDELTSDYVLDFAAQKQCSATSENNDSLLAATSSNYTIRIYNRNTLANVQSITGHANVITGVQFGHTESNLLFSSSLDKTVRCWDLRMDLKKAAEIYEGAELSNLSFTCVDVNCKDRLLSSGTEVTKDDDAYILFWDRRKNACLGCYKECHQDDITQVRFSPQSPDRLASGSTDGLVCVFDVSQSNEEDALTSILNSQSSVANIGWCGDGCQNIYCITDISTLHVWDSEEGNCVCEFSDLKERFEDEKRFDYLVDCIVPPDTDDLLVIGGTYSGNLHALRLLGDNMEYHCSLRGGHSETVRCIHWSEQSQTLVTGGEDSFLCLWSTQLRSPAKAKAKLKMKSPAKKGKVPYEKGKKS